MTLRLDDLVVACVIGDLPDERTHPQRLSVSVALEVSDRAAETDDLADTVDYAALSVQIRETLVQGRFRLIERAAKAVCDTCLAQKNVRTVSVSVTKAGAVANLASATAIVRGTATDVRMPS